MIKHTFTDHDAVLPIFFPGVLLRVLSDLGIDSKLVLTSDELKKISFSDETEKISFTQLKLLLSNAIQLSQNPHLGWHFGRHINVTSLGLVGYAAMSAPTLAKALETIAQFFKIRDPIYELSLTRPQNPDELAYVQIDEALDFSELRYFLLSSVVSGAASLITYFSNQNSPIQKAELACPPPSDWPDSNLPSGFPVSFNTPYTRIYFDARLLHQAIPTADPQTERSTREICEQLLARIENQSGLVGQVRSFILAQHGSYPGLEEAAAHFCVSSRTFRRELAKSGTRYQLILDTVREKIALEYLLKTTKPIQEIAYELGFNDISNFGRAFKRWTGKAPSEFRAK